MALDTPLKRASAIGLAMAITMGSPPQGGFNVFERADNCGCYAGYVYQGAQAFYVDPTNAAPGAGTIANPWNDWTQPTAFEGNMAASTLSMKSGTTIEPDTSGVITPALQLTGVSNLVITNYNAGANPVIDGSIVALDTWVNTSGSIWSVVRAAQTQFFANGFMLVGQTGSPSAAGQQYTSGGFTFVWLPGNANPNTVTMREGTQQYGVQLTSCAGITIQNFTVQRNFNANIKLTASGNNVTIQNCSFLQPGNSTTNIMSNISIDGNHATPSTGISVLNNILDQAIYSDNLDAEYTNGLTVSGNTLSNSAQGLELYSNNANPTVHGNYISNVTSGPQTASNYLGLWIADTGSGGGNNSGAIITSNVIFNIQSGGILVADGSGHLILNNSLWNTTTDSNQVPIFIRKDGSTTPAATVENNVIEIPSAGAAWMLQFAASTTVTAIDYNCYFVVGGSGQYAEWEAPNNNATALATAALNFAVWQTTIGFTYDVHGQLADPKFTSIGASPNLRPLAGSPVFNAGVANANVVTDILGIAYTNPPAQGAYATALSGIVVRRVSFPWSIMVA